jgi:hypothetical protein
LVNREIVVGFRTRAGDLISSPKRRDQLWSPLSLHFRSYWGFLLWRESRPKPKPVIHLHLTLILKMNGCITPLRLPHLLFGNWRGGSVTFVSVLHGVCRYILPLFPFRCYLFFITFVLAQVR